MVFLDHPKDLTFTLRERIPTVRFLKEFEKGGVRGLQTILIVNSQRWWKPEVTEDEIHFTGVETERRKPVERSITPLSNNGVKRLPRFFYVIKSQTSWKTPTNSYLHSWTLEKGQTLLWSLRLKTRNTIGTMRNHSPDIIWVFCLTIHTEGEIKDVIKHILTIKQKEFMHHL